MIVKQNSQENTNSQFFPKKHSTIHALKASREALKASRAAHGAATHAAATPHLNKMGGNSEMTYVIDGELFTSVLSNDGSKVLVNTPNVNPADSDAAFVDWLNFTFKTSDFLKIYKSLVPPSDSSADEYHNIVFAISQKLSSILGFGVSEDRERGLNRYERSYVLGDGFGFLCIGGLYQNGTCLIMLNGQAMTALRAKPWHSPMVKFLKTLNDNITRVDLSTDFFHGEYNLQQAVDDYKNNLFRNNPGVRVSSRLAGDWLSVDDKDGRTLYIGKKQNGKELCIYEKGKQLGGRYSQSLPDWVRVELRLGNKDRIIPYDVLLNCGSFLSGSYPALHFIHEVHDQIKTAKATAKIKYEKAKSVLKQQFGKLLYLVSVLDQSLSDVVDVSGIPKRLVVPDVTNLSLPDLSLSDFHVASDFDIVF